MCLQNQEVFAGFMTNTFTVWASHWCSIKSNNKKKKRRCGEKAEISVTVWKTNIPSFLQMRVANHKHENVKTGCGFALRLCVCTVSAAACGCFLLSYVKLIDISTNCNVMREIFGKTKVLRGLCFGFADFNWLQFSKVSLTDGWQPC